MTIVPSPADAVVSLSWQVTSGGTTTTEQASGVLIAPDEVLTAAHLVYDASGQTVGNIVVSSGAGGSPIHAVATEGAVHAMPFTDWTRVSNAASDFALVHLASPVSGLPTMALGSDFEGGTASVTGYPLATAGFQDTALETLTPLAWSTGILEGTALGVSGDPRGSSGGAVWHTVDGTPTVVGLVSSASGTTGYFTDFTAEDVAQIDAWMAADHDRSGVSPATGRQRGSAASVVAGLETEAFGLPALSSHPAMDAALHRVVSLLAHEAASSPVGSQFDAVAGDAFAKLGNAGGQRTLALALLEGVTWGYDAHASVGTVAATDPGLLSSAVNHRGVHIGAVVGQALFRMGF